MSGRGATRATASQWLAGARPRTLPAALAPVAVGTGAAAAEGRADLLRALAALVVAVALQVGVNYANDYSDGVRGTDRDRHGPLRLVGAGVATPNAVRTAALLSFGVAAVAGLWLAAMTSWWLLLIGAAAIVAAWFYTGGSRPYGYRGFGEISVFVFFGLVATVGTTFVQIERVPPTSVAGGVGCGALACAILVANNLRDLDGDELAGKRTLAVLLGDRRTRWLYLGLLCLAYAAVAVIAAAVPWVLLALTSVVAALPAAKRVVRGARGAELIPVLQATALTLLVYGLILGAALGFGS